METSAITAVVVLIVYFLPAINGYSKRHRSRAMILALNFFLGWTLIGWVVALAWSASNAKDDPDAPSPRTHIKCPDCAELILKEAKRCRHCGCKLISPES